MAGVDILYLKNVLLKFLDAAAAGRTDQVPPPCCRAASRTRPQSCTGHHSSLWWRPWPTRRLGALPLPFGCLAWVLRQLARTCRAAVPSLAPLRCRALRCQTEGLIEGLKSAA